MKDSTRLMGGGMQGRGDFVATHDTEMQVEKKIKLRMKTKQEEAMQCIFHSNSVKE